MEYTDHLRVQGELAARVGASRRDFCAAVNRGDAAGQAAAWLAQHEAVAAYAAQIIANLADNPHPENAVQRLTYALDTLLAETPWPAVALA